MYILVCSGKCISYHGLWSKKGGRLLVWTVHFCQTNVPEVQSWSYRSPDQTPLTANGCWWKKVLLSLRVPRPSWFSLVHFPLYLLLLAFTGSNQSGLLSVPWIHLMLSVLWVFTYIAPLACSDISTNWLYFSAHEAVWRGGKGQTSKSHQPEETNFRLCHLFSGQLCNLKTKFLYLQKGTL